MARVGVPAAAADDRDGVGRLLEQAEHRLDGTRARWLVDWRNDGTVFRLDLVAQHVFGERQHNRAWTAGGSDPKGPGDIFGDAPRIVDPRRPFGDGAEKGGHVQ